MSLYIGKPLFMFEVEAKVPIKRGDYKALKKRLTDLAEYLGTRRSDDAYYEKLKKATIRIRKRGGEYSFDLKRREVIEGIESNIEMEWKLSNPVAWRRILNRLKLDPNIRKTKKTELYKMKGFLIELNEIRSLGYYLEIERVVKGKADVRQAKKELIQLFKDLGYSQSKFEPKRYLELLKNV